MWWMGMSVVSPTSRFAYKSIRLQVNSPTLTSIRLHDLSCFAYTFIQV